jgi:hypothetical protein
MRQLLILCFVIYSVCLGTDSYAQDSTASSQCSNRAKSSEGWSRFYLSGPNGDAICVDLPGRPEKFAGGKLRGGKTPVTADVYLFGEHNEIYTVTFVYDLPTKTEDMPDEQKAEIFFGTWRGTIENGRLALENMTGKPIEIQYAEQHKVKVMGHEGRVQLFKVGSDLGQARMVFVGKKAYMLMGVWPPDRAKRLSSAFFDHFEMRVKQ